MKTLFTISILISFYLTYGQAPTIISGILVDEKGNPVEAAMFHYGLNNATEDTSYTDKKGSFKIAYPNPQKNWYYFYIEREGFLPKTLFIDLLPSDINIDTPIVFRSRKGHWYDSKQIDSTHLGITVRQAIQKYKLDINACRVINEPPGVSRGFRTELADSSYVCFMINRYFDMTMQKMNNILDSTIIGMIQIIERFFLKKAKLIKSNLPIDQVLIHLLQDKNPVNIDQLAKKTCVSIRQLERQFKERIGLPPKVFSRLVRFSNVCTMRENNPALSWQEIAHTCCYADQMLMIRDFKEFAGVTPGILQTDLEKSPLRLQHTDFD